MGRGSVSSKFLVILNTFYTLLGMGIVSLSVWFYIEIKNLTSLRNPNHFALNTRVYWPQAVPWMYATVGTFIVLISCCAFLGVTKKSRAVLLTNVTFQIIAVMALGAVATVTILRADSKASDDFIAEAIEDAFHHMRDERGEDVKKGFGDLEMRLQCCGTNTSISYKRFSRSYEDNLPVSCCNSLDSEHPVKVCSFDDTMANSRPGCIDVANLYVRIVMKIFAAAAILTAFVGVLNLISAAWLSKGLTNTKNITREKNMIHRNGNGICAANEFEKIEKVPLKV